VLVDGGVMTARSFVSAFSIRASDSFPLWFLSLAILAARAVPEPTSLLLFGCGLVSLSRTLRRCRQRG
jgi:hypothetical protein